eukprot:CAMPEP_0177537802 /NCGR_PEP_ID=MMETSP0369-20130122/57986_1 /TAXON_ID=447022 ORGANISM="Scrippsiella hangoei-like, Strain SHHI-4" /NCGR_SAMPLE_ID=MMETSP0369 /ASSEMBLY_ACC=CAM_ASM_000364 /LENGTH=120 /DNA_ID=CAMNT_0019020467 /DNA_START=186 /DNA_END=545 /DNA_ORIENTATION=-
MTDIAFLRLASNTWIFFTAGFAACSSMGEARRVRLPGGSSAKSASNSFVSMLMPCWWSSFHTVFEPESPRRKELQYSFFTWMPGLTSGFLGSAALGGALGLGAMPLAAAGAPALPLPLPL